MEVEVAAEEGDETACTFLNEPALGEVWLDEAAEDGEAEADEEVELIGGIPLNEGKPDKEDKLPDELSLEVQDRLLRKAILSLSLSLFSLKRNN